MTIARLSVTLAAAAWFAGLPGAHAQLHDADFIVRVRDGAIETGVVLPDAGLTFPYRLIGSRFGDSGLADRTTNPGFQADDTMGVPPAAEINFRVTRALRLWQGGAFEVIPDERMTIRKDSVTITTPLSDPVPAESGPSVTIAFTGAPTGEFHEHPGYRLLAPAQTGLYLLTGVIWTTAEGVAPSEPVYVIFRQNVSDPAELEAAADWVFENLIGTPTCSADFNADGVITSLDVSDFFNAWFTDQATGSLGADFDADGASTAVDVSLFLNDWFLQSAAGGC